MFDRALVLSASSGAGHTRAAQAIEKALRLTGAAREVQHIDTLQYTNKVFRRLYSKGYVDIASNAPDVFGWLYDRLDQPWKNERLRLTLDRLNTFRFVKLLKTYEPDIAICTHFLPAEITSWLKAKKVLSCPQAVVVTDFDVHAMWLVHKFERYFVARDEARAYLETLGIPAAKVMVSGIPIDPAFAVSKDRRTMREKHGLKVDATTIIVSAGGFGIGRSGGMKSIIDSLFELNRPLQIIAAYGNNKRLGAEIDAAANQHSNGMVAIKPLGYTELMHEFMAASDIIVGKPGGLTSSEALASGLAMVIVNPIPGQEERNSDHLLEQGVAVRCNTLSTLSYKIERILDEPGRLAKMQETALKIARPHAAYDIVDNLLKATN
ncbi:MAG TPA: UDP-N-acetylglucosamine 2-epimerase [Blastocatellia bacterium]